MSYYLMVVYYSTVQYSTVQYSTVQYSTVQYSTVQKVQYHKRLKSCNVTGMFPVPVPVEWLPVGWRHLHNRDPHACN